MDAASIDAAHALLQLQYKTNQREVRHDKFCQMVPGTLVRFVSNHCKGHHDVTTRQQLTHVFAIVISQPQWPSTWFTLRVVDTNKVVKVRSTNVCAVSELNQSDRQWH